MQGSATFPSRRAVLQGMAAMGGASLLGAAAQTGQWPSKPVRLIVPYNAGGGTDIIARALAEPMSRLLGQPVVVDNRGGAGGILGTDAVLKSQPDGHTLLVGLGTSMMVNQYLYTKLPHDLQKDMALVTQVATVPVVLVAHPSVPASNMKELLAYVGANKGKFSYGSWGQGSQAHLVGAYISKSANADMGHAAYKGEAPMLQDLIGGQIQFCLASVSSSRPFIESGRLKAIGLIGRQRVPSMPNVPTIYEQGLTDDPYALVGWIGMGAPAGIPKPVLDKLAAVMAEVAKDAKVQEQIFNIGGVAVMAGPEAFRTAYQGDVPKWKALIEAANVRLD
ncbi:Bug family tripartite tricarboxylate transporter substrate binding protein [Pseudorhodoferax sp.]|uniref:Bug family tripartite tricarboxylate transporter substrate binding protein n=1 Tax=Pseudorhodoferax sp. TaxID=1993553 RepID=UPI0039E4DBBE